MRSFNEDYVFSYFKFKRVDWFLVENIRFDWFDWCEFSLFLGGLCFFFGFFGSGGLNVGLNNNGIFFVSGGSVGNMGGMLFMGRLVRLELLYMLGEKEKKKKKYKNLEDKKKDEFWLVKLNFCL